MGRVEESGEQAQASGLNPDAERQASAWADAPAEESSNLAEPEDAEAALWAPQSSAADPPAEAQDLARQDESLAAPAATAPSFVAEDSFHTRLTDLSLIAVGSAETGDSAPRQSARPRVRIAAPRGRLALLAPIAAALLIAGVVLSGLGLQGRGVADLAGAPFFAARSHATATATLAPTATASATPVLNTPTPGPVIPRDRTPALNAAMGCASGAPSALAKPIYTSKSFIPGAPPPNEVALTFDDGPTPYTTPPILDFLERTHTPATFFVEGLYSRVWPYLVQREWNDGFAIGMHSWDHPVLTILPDSQMPHQFGESLDAIHAAIGKTACLWFWRPPYGSYDPRIIAIAQSYGLTTVMWDDDSVDYSRPGPERIAATVLAEAHPGAVILMHDGPARREQTLAALPLILEGLKARGLTPVTLPRLLADSQYPGVDMSIYPRRNKPDAPLNLPLDAPHVDS
jgi:peptidoglycan/xylan/chitin deacetylase (PgdA/CDA1 family)